MTFRPLFAALLALVMALAPFGMPAMAEAAIPMPHHGATAGQGHCDQQPRPDHHRKAAEKNCCTAMCVAMVVPATGTDLPSYPDVRERPASDLDRCDFLGEIATPPPRLA